MYASSSSSSVTDSASRLSERWEARGLDLRGFGSGRFEDAFDRATVEEAHQLLHRMRTDANTDARPVAALFSLVLWDMRTSETARTSPLWALRHFEIWWVFAGLVVLGGARLATRRRRLQARDGLWATFAGGACGLGLEVILLLIFQNAAGSLYWLLGLLVALFMVGLTVGTSLSSQICRRHPESHRRVATVVDAVAIVTILAAPFLPWLGAATGWACGLWLFVAGLVTGGIFPPSVIDLRHVTAPRGPGRAAGLADAADHLGACLGALTVGLVLLPLFGAWSTCFVLAAVRAVSLVGWISAPAGATSRERE